MLYYVRRPALPGLISPNVKKRLDKPRSVWYNGASDTIAIALRFRTGARAPKISMKSRRYAIFFASAMFHVEHGFWNACYKIGAPNENHSHLGFSGTSSFSQQKKNPLSKNAKRIFWNACFRMIVETWSVNKTPFQKRKGKASRWKNYCPFLISWINRSSKAMRPARLSL